ncbi:hypothetical protein, variant [Aphanomyces astaci]|uniref:Vesicle transport protein n=1 Tax=Aphanomyces astaci TaxID=112090 RepID=W4HBY3_APHAT|nr:hypothetical protein H257_00451 [Aphanomyces astaci]XP_009821466.1 hypothetical protein, variant [Aphanomyces astaci]ETV89065.1 hypothetical protein H257_00451 [Aphanomyces astaci]ETV89066.1 hypothetical protein, variant [Aphanomyces astaci]|eukprot:XP_009821465.1 hypothetical protein H257_00451 [Aphanomyces astaci]
MDRVRILFGAPSSTSTSVTSSVEAAVAAVSIKMPKGTAAPKEDTMSDMSFGCKSLTKVQRLYGFAICFCAGYLINLMSTFVLLGGSRNGAKFGILYSIGSLVSLCGSGFLAGPAEQVKSMANPVRRAATAIYLCSIVFVLVIAVTNPQLGLLILFLAMVQFGAAVWYNASYIPYGRKLLKTFGSKCLGSMQ